MIPSAQQQALFDLFLSDKRSTGPRHVVVRARAGTGKTTSVCELVKRLLIRWPRLRVVACAFSKETATELERRVPRVVTSATLHSLGLRAQSEVRKTRVDGQRDHRLAVQACAGHGLISKSALELVLKLATMGKECLPLCQSPDELTDLQLDFDLLPDEEDRLTATWVRERAFAAMLLALEFDGTCSYSDMVYVTVRLGLARAVYDLVIVDEAQDMNPGQLLLALALCRPGGRILVVGDDRQAIYAFRGAARGALDALKAELGAVELPLTVTRRCPQLVVGLAQCLVPDFTADPGAPVGTVDALAAGKLTQAAKPGDFILSRTNAPLVSECLRLVASGTPARVRGRNLGAGLVALITKAKARTLEDVETYLAKWADKQLRRAAKLSEAGAERLAQEVEDQQLALAALIESVETVDDLVAKIESMFSDLKEGDVGYVPSVTLSTVHKAKGLEADRVFLLEKTFTREGDEEDNIRYVALTRAKRHLTLVGGAS